MAQVNNITYNNTGVTVSMLLFIIYVHFQLYFNMYL